MTPDLSGWTVAFDLDGTLVDTAPDLLGALNHVLAGVGLAAVGPDDIRTLIGHGARAMLRHGLAAQGAEPARADGDDLFDAFIDHYTAHIADHSHPFDGVQAALDALAAAGATLSVCTNKRQCLAEQLLETLGLTHRFAAIVGADSVPAKKPDGGHVRAAVERAGGAMERALLIGDSRTDERAARDAGLPFIFVTFGYEAASPGDITCSARIAHYRELVPAIARLVG